MLNLNLLINWIETHPVIVGSVVFPSTFLIINQLNRRRREKIEDERYKEQKLKNEEKERDEKNIAVLHGFITCLFSKYSISNYYKKTYEEDKSYFPAVMDEIYKYASHPIVSTNIISIPSTDEKNLTHKEWIERYILSTNPNFKTLNELHMHDTNVRLKLGLSLPHKIC